MSVIRYTAIPLTDTCDGSSLTVLVVTRITSDEDQWFYETLVSDYPFGSDEPWQVIAAELYERRTDGNYRDAIAAHSGTVRSEINHYSALNNYSLRTEN